MQRCERCEGFVPEGLSACPACGADERDGRFARFMVKLAKWVGPGVIATTLMACYGASPSMRMNQPYPDGAQASPCAPGYDQDGDRQCAPSDCNDQDPYVNPGASDPIGDGVDSNCDGVDGPRDYQSTQPVAPVGLPNPG